MRCEVEKDAELSYSNTFYVWPAFYEFISAD